MFLSGSVGLPSMTELSLLTEASNKDHQSCHFAGASPFPLRHWAHDIPQLATHLPAGKVVWRPKVGFGYCDRIKQGENERQCNEFAMRWLHHPRMCVGPWKNISFAQTACSNLFTKFACNQMLECEAQNVASCSAIRCCVHAQSCVCIYPQGTPDGWSEPSKLLFALKNLMMSLEVKTHSHASSSLDSCLRRWPYRYLTWKTAVIFFQRGRNLALSLWCRKGQHLLAARGVLAKLSSRKISTHGLIDSWVQPGGKICSKQCI